MRDEFSEKVKRTVAARVGYRCSNCQKPTMGPQVDSTKFLNIGVAAHITAASPGGPRYNPELSPVQRKHPDNAIWLCQDCAKLIDDDEARFTEEELRQWKHDAEKRANELIGKSEISSHARKLLKYYNEVMEIEAERINPLLDWPVLKDLKSGERSEVYIDEDKLIEIDQKLTNPRNRRILLKGFGGRGKTVLSRLIAYKKHRKNWKVYFVDLRELGSSNTDVDTLIDEIKETIKSCEGPTLFIFENAHLYDDVTYKLVKSADSLAKNKDCLDSHFLFNSRDLARDKDLDPFVNWKESGLLSLVSPNSEIVEKIINQFIQANKIQYTLSQTDQEWIKTNIEPREDAGSDQAGGDLRLLRLYLIAWRYNTDRRLCALQEQDVTKSLKKFLLVDELSGEIALADLLGKVSSVFQFDVPFYSRRAGWSDSKDYIIDLENLRKKGKIKYIGTDFYTLTHSLDAYYITRCLADHNKQTHSEYTGTKIVEYISELPNQPANIIVENLVQLFRAFYNSQQDFQKDAFRYIFSNARNRIIDLIIEYCEGLGDLGRKYHEGLGILSRILNLVEIYLGKEEAASFWKKVCEYIKPEAWQEIFIRNKPFYIALLIQIIQRISPEHEEDVEKFKFIIDNFDGIYKKSDLHRLQDIFKHLPNSVIDKLIGKMDVPSFASKIIESKPFYLEFIIKKLNDDFLKEVFLHIKAYEWDNFLIFFRRLEGKKYPISLFDRIRAMDRELADNLRHELKSFFEDLKIQNRKRSPDGRLLINNKIANNYSNKKFSNDDFRKYLSANFEDNFQITIDNPKIAQRLIKKTFYSTYNYPQRKHGSHIIERIIYQLPDRVLKVFCRDLDLLALIKTANKRAYHYVCSKELEESEQGFVAFALFGNKIKLVLLTPEGTYKFVDDAQNLHSIIYVVSSEVLVLQTAVEELESLVNDPKAKEKDFQDFFERYPDFILHDEYKDAHSHIVLTRKDAESLIPDFVLEPLEQSQLCDLLDLKLPSAQIFVLQKRRMRFSAAVLAACAQLREYNLYFDEAKNREKIYKKYGLLAYKPKMFVIIGRRGNVSPIEVRKMQADLPNVYLRTYDDIICRMKARVEWLKKGRETSK